ncbi:MAG: CU044_2847 family protein [Acidobacteriota bacterium]
MSDAVAFDLDGGGTVIIEVLGHQVVEQPASGGMKPAGTLGRKESKAVEKAGHTLKKALGAVKDTAQSVIETFDEVEGPDTIGLEFQVGFTLTGDAVIVKGESNASFKVSLSWTKPTAKNGSSE